MKKYMYKFEFILLILLSFFISTAELSEAFGQTEHIDISYDKTFTDEILKVIQNADGLTYKTGSRSKGVREFQNLLLSSGYSTGKADGVYGNKTSAAVREFQTANNLTVTGNADLPTQFYLVMQSCSFKRKRNAFIAQVKNYAVIIWPGKAFYIGAVDKSTNLVEGTYCYLSGGYYAGEYKNNLRFGKGTAHFANGDVYIGQWKNDAMHGRGTYYYGGIDSGEYYRGNMTNSTMNGKGTYCLNGLKITGKWFYNRHVNWQ